MYCECFRALQIELQVFVFTRLIGIYRTLNNPEIVFAFFVRSLVVVPQQTPFALSGKENTLRNEQTDQTLPALRISRHGWGRVDLAVVEVALMALSVLMGTYSLLLMEAMGFKIL